MSKKRKAHFIEEDFTALKKKKSLQFQNPDQYKKIFEHLDSNKYLTVNETLLIFDDTSYNSNAVPLTCTAL